MHRTRAISWTDGDTPEYQDGCRLMVVRFAAAAALVLSALALGGSVWSGKGVRR